MRKILKWKYLTFWCVVIAVSFCVNTYEVAAANTYKISALSSANATWISDSHKMLVPALATVASGATLGGAAQWLGVGLSSTALANIIGIVAIAGVTASAYWMTTEIISYLKSKGYGVSGGQVVSNGVTMYDHPVGTAKIPGDQIVNGAYTYVFYGVYADYTTMASVWNTLCANPPAGYNYYTAASGSPYDFVGVSGWSAMNVMYQSQQSPYTYKYYCVYYPTGGNKGTSTVQQTWPIAQGTIVTGLTTDLNNSLPGAIDAGRRALADIEDALKNPNNPLVTSGQMGQIQSYLGGALTADQKSKLDAGVVTDADTWAGQTGAGTLANPTESGVSGLTAADVQNGIIAALTAKGLSSPEIATAIAAAIPQDLSRLTPDDIVTAIITGLPQAGIPTTPEIEEAIREAIPDAINDESGVTYPSDPFFTLPEKLSLTTILNNFWSSMSSMPVINTLKGITINASGSSVACMNLPANLGGSRCWDAANIQGDLNNIGSVLLSLTTILAMIGIFKD